MPITKTGKTQNGLQQYRVRINYTDITGKYKQIERTAYGRAEALELERKLSADINRADTPSARLTLRALSDEYLEALAHDVRETTWDKAKRDLEIILSHGLADLRLDRLSIPQLQKWKNTTAELDLALATKRSHYKRLSALLNFAVKRQYISSNPLSLIGNFKDPYFSQPEEQLHYYTSDEFLRFISIARKEAEEKNTLTEWGFYVFFEIAFYTGMRKGEINALRWSDLEDNIIHVRRSIAQKLKGEDRETPPKNKSSYRDLQAPLPLLDILSEHRARQASLGLPLSELRICGGDACLRDTSIEKHNQHYAAMAGLPHLRIHDFRHTHATLLINEGINIQEIARRLGHSNVEITWSTYAHLYPREEERAVNILNQIR